jgi:hypothetical protein
MGLAIGNATVTSGANAQNVTVPALLVGGTLDTNGPLTVSQATFAKLASTDKSLVVIQNGVHRHFDSAYCAEMDSSGLIENGNSNAKLDIHTLNGILVSPNSGLATDFCGLDSFPTAIRSYVHSYILAHTIPPFSVTFDSSHVPTHGLTSDMVKDQVISLAVSFFGRVLNRADGDDRPFSDCLPDEFKNQPPVPDPTQQDLDAAEMHADEPD